MDKPFDRANVGLRERPVSSDHNRIQSQIYRTIQSLMGSLHAPRVSNTSAGSQQRTGFIGDGFRVVPSSPAAMTVQVSPGFGFVYDATDVPEDIGATDLENVDDLSPFKPLVLMAPVTFALSAPSVGNSRIDIIEVRVNRDLTDSLTRRQLDVTTKQYLDHSFYKTLTYALDDDTGTVNNVDSTAALSYKIGAPSASPSAPAVTAGYVKIAEVRTGSGTVSVVGGNIGDYRALLGAGGIVPASVQFRLQYNAGTPIVTIEKMIAPPSVEIGIDPNSNRGSFEAAIIGGNFTGIAYDVRILQDPTDAGWINLNLRNTSGGTLVHALTSTDQANYSANFSPAILAAQGQPTTRLLVTAGRFDSGGPDFSTTDVLLEDIRYTVNFLLSYF